MRLARRPFPRSCDRVREQVSLRLDGELSQLEHAFVDRHLERCAGCADYAAELEAVAQLLRSAPLEQPEWTFALPRRRSSTLRIVQMGAAAATIAAAVGLGSLDAFSRARTHSVTPRLHPAPTAYLDRSDELQPQKRAAATPLRHRAV